MAVRVDSGESSIYLENNGDSTNLLGSIGLFGANYGGHANQIAVSNDTGWQYSTTQYLTPNAWNLLTIGHQNGTSQYAVSLNGHTPQVFTGFVNTGSPLKTCDSLEVLNDASNGVAYFDSANVCQRQQVLGLPSAQVGAGLGVNIHFYASFGYSGNGNGFQDLKMIQAAGCGFVRMDMGWNAIETTLGQYNFGACDNLYSACVARGLRVLFILDYGNTLYGADPTSSTWQKGYANFSAATAAHYKGRSNIYEVWNEPDGGLGLPGMSNPTTYMQVADLAVPAMRTADLSCTIVGPAAGSGDTSFLKSCIQQGLLNLVDAVSVHPYRSSAPETAMGDYATIGSLMQTYGHKTVPIVSSEWGYSTGAVGASYTPVSTQLQGDYLARSFLVNLSQGIPLSIWYDWKNDGTDSTAYEQNFGTVTADLVPKPAYNEMHLLTASLKGETFSRKLGDDNSADWLLVFTGGGHTTLAAWTTGTADTAIVPGWGTLHLTSTPFYVNPTLLPGDANLDGMVNVQDLAILAANYRKQVTGGWLQGDFNNDGVVDVEDLALLAANYRHSYASDVVPAYDGLDAEAIQLLSLAGVTVLPSRAT